MVSAAWSGLRKGLDRKERRALARKCGGTPNGPAAATVAQNLPDLKIAVPRVVIGVIARAPRPAVNLTVTVKATVLRPVAAKVAMVTSARDLRPVVNSAPDRKVWKDRAVPVALVVRRPSRILTRMATGA